MIISNGSDSYWLVNVILFITKMASDQLGSNLRIKSLKT
jgi:hypothetical protein